MLYVDNCNIDSRIDLSINKQSCCRFHRRMSKKKVENRYIGVKKKTEITEPSSENNDTY